MGRRKQTAKNPFEVRLSHAQEDALKLFIARELDYAIMARMAVVGNDGILDDANLKYLGGDCTLTKDTPWPNAANLGSPLVTEKVDAMRARIMATIFTDPIWIVEGLGPAAERAWLVEEFHQWKADQTKLQPAMGRAVHTSLIEGTGILEVNDRVVMRKGVRQIKAAVQTDPATGNALLDQTGNVQPKRDAKDKFIEADDPEHQPHAKMVISDIVRATDGPSYRVLSLKDFYILPGDASENEDIWGYAKRVFRRLSELTQREQQGYYTNTDQLGGDSSNERLSPTGGVGDANDLQRQGQDIAPQQHEVTAQKEIWELSLLMDLDEDGYDEWYIVTWSQIHRQILRIQYQNYDTPQYIILTPFPRPGSVYGFSYAKDKLGSLYDEHVALRNIAMDRMILKTNQPILQVDGGLWNPALKPWGPGKVIPVRSMDDIKQMEVADVPQSTSMMKQEVLSFAERLSGMNDTTTGQTSQADRTLGEIKLVTQQSWIRIDEVVKNLQQAFEDLFTILNTMWRMKLEDTPEPWPGDILVSMEQRAINMGPMITADVLDGPFRGKPRGSVEASDFSQMRADTVQMITAITQLSQQVPALKVQLNNPATIRSILTQIARIYRWPDRQNLVSNFNGQGPPPPPPEPPPAPKVSIALKGDLSPQESQQLASGAPGASGPPGMPGGMPGGPMPPPPVGIPGISNMPVPPGAPNGQ